MSIDLLLLTLTILRALLLHLVVQTEEHLVTVFFVFNLLLLYHLGVLEFSQLLLRLQERLHLAFPLLLLRVVTLDHVCLLRVEPSTTYTVSMGGSKVKYSKSHHKLTYP